MDVLKGLFGNKRWYQSLTGLSVATLALIGVLETTGVVMPGTSTLISTTVGAAAGAVDAETVGLVQTLFGKALFLLDKVADLGVILGIRKAATAANVV